MKNYIYLILSSILFLSACSDQSNDAKTADTSSKVTYVATLAEGIDFKKEGYPDFINEVSGMSGFEPWGRWSDADAGGSVVRFTFRDKLPEAFNLVLTANAFGPNDGKPILVKAGQVTQEWIIINGAEPGTYTIKFEKVDSNTLEFTPPEPTSPLSQTKDNPDPRKLGIGFVSLKIE